MLTASSSIKSFAVDNPGRLLHVCCERRRHLMSETDADRGDNLIVEPRRSIATTHRWFSRFFPETETVGVRKVCPIAPRRHSYSRQSRALEPLSQTLLVTRMSPSSSVSRCGQSVIVCLLNAVSSSSTDSNAPTILGLRLRSSVVGRISKSSFVDFPDTCQ